MAMTVEEWNTLINGAISNPSDQSTVLSALTQARDAYTDLFSERTALEAQSQTLSEENTRLKQTNMDLFLRIGQQQLKPDIPAQEISRAESIKIDDLWKEQK